jgi:outer membrane lipopolysaccharide assembly protein LptE/RlpB
MKKIIFCLFIFTLFGCVGYEPLFSTKNLSYYIVGIENVNSDNVTKKISKNLDSNKFKIDNKKGYLLKISSNKSSTIVSRDTKGQVTSYEMIVNVEVKVFSNNSLVPSNILQFNKNFAYKNQANKSNLNQYKINILNNMINIISQDIVIKLQSL